MLGWAGSSLSTVPCSLLKFQSCSSDGRDAGPLPRSAPGCRVPRPAPCSCHVRSAGHSAVPAMLIAPVFQPRRPAALEALWPLRRCSLVRHSATLSCPKSSCSRATVTASASVRLESLTGFCVELCLCGLGWLAVSPQPLLLTAEAFPGLTPPRNCEEEIIIGTVAGCSSLSSLAACLCGAPMAHSSLLPSTNAGRSSARGKVACS